jgi:hypothetical protein
MMTVISAATAMASLSVIEYIHSIRSSVVSFLKVDLKANITDTAACMLNLDCGFLPAFAMGFLGSAYFALNHKTLYSMLLLTPLRSYMPTA